MKNLREIFNLKPRVVELREFPSQPACGAVEPEQQQGKGASYGDHSVHIGGGNVHGSLTVSAWYRGIELRANTMSQLPLILQRYDATHGNYIEDRKLPGSIHLNYLLQVRPNPMMSRVVFMRQAEENRILKGNAVIYIERDSSGEVVALWLCDTATLNIVRNSYYLTYIDENGYVAKSDVPASDVLHIRNSFTDYNGLVGIPTLVFASRSLSISATSDNETLDNAGKGGKMKLLVQEDKAPNFGLGRANKDQLRKITNQLNQDIYQQDVVLLSNIVGVTPISQNAQQMEMLESRKFSVSDIARFLSVPKALLMDDSGSSYKSPEAATQEFLLRTLAPAICEWETELMEKLIGVEGFGTRRIHLCEKPLLRLDAKGQAEIDKMQLEMGVKSPNELRADYDLPSIQDGDKHYLSTNLAAVGSEKLEKGGQQ